MTQDAYDEPQRERWGNTRVWTEDELVLRRVAVIRDAVVADGTDLDIGQLTVDGSTVSVVFAGDHAPSDIDDLGQEMEQALGRDVDLEVTIVPTIRLSYETSDGN